MDETTIAWGVLFYYATIGLALLWAFVFIGIPIITAIAALVGLLWLGTLNAVLFGPVFAVIWVYKNVVRPVALGVYRAGFELCYRVGLIVTYPFRGRS